MDSTYFPSIYYLFSRHQSRWQASRYTPGMNCLTPIPRRKAPPARVASFREVIRVGFVPLCDCAPLVMAHELGFFAARGLRVELSREVGWATIRDKIALRELQAAHAPAAMVLGLTLGIGAFSAPCVTGLVLNLHGNAVTLSNRLRGVGAQPGASPSDSLPCTRKGDRLIFGVAFSCSSHGWLLQKWLRAGGLEPGRDVNTVVVPPPQMAANLKAGNLDGYCVGEPWNSVAVVQRAGWIAAASPGIAPEHPEKVLLVRSDFAAARADEHERLISALLQACEFCQDAANREQLVQTLATPKYLNTSAEAIRRSLCGPFKFGLEQTEKASDLHIFAGPRVNEPDLAKAAWVRDSLLETGVLPKSTPLPHHRLAEMFRADIFNSVTKHARTHAR